MWKNSQLGAKALRLPILSLEFQNFDPPEKLNRKISRKLGCPSDMQSNATASEQDSLPCCLLKSNELRSQVLHALINSCLDDLSGLCQCVPNVGQDIKPKRRDVSPSVDVPSFIAQQTSIRSKRSIRNLKILLQPPSFPY